MTPIYTQVSQIMDAQPEQIDMLLNEYRNGERAIMPQSYFMDLRREDGAEETGSMISVMVSFTSVKHEFKEFVAKPTPLRLIMEYDAENETMIMIVADVIRYTDKTRVTISTLYTTFSNFTYLVADILIPGNLHHIYDFQQFVHDIQTDDAIRQAS